MKDISLEDVLALRDRRARLQTEMTRKHGKPLVCFTMNIAGPVKTDEETAYAFRVGCSRLLAGLKTMGFQVLERQELSSPAGFGLLLAVDAPSLELKRLCVSLEEVDPLGRLFDMDVIGEDGRKIPRNVERSCLVCGQPGRGCASRRVHPVEEVQRITRRIIQDHRIQAESERIASLAVQSLMDEVCVTPKPGLVDCRDRGSHRDMDLFTFTASAAALFPYFQKCFLAGIQGRDLPAEEAFEHLQRLGMEAERTMRETTGNVNTHKGAIYALGVLCGAAGWTGSHELSGWLETCGRLTVHRQGPGVRAEVAKGFPSVREIGLPVLHQAREQGLSFNDQCLTVLLHLLSEVEDTNMIARGGAQSANAAKNQARALLAYLETGEPGSGIRDIMGRLNTQYVSDNLSPGGCADLLAVTLLADRWTGNQPDGLE